MGLEEGVTLPVCDNLETKSRKRKRSSSPSAHTAGGAQRKSQSLPKLGDEVLNLVQSLLFFML